MPAKYKCWGKRNERIHQKFLIRGSGIISLEGKLIKIKMCDINSTATTEKQNKEFLLSQKKRILNGIMKNIQLIKKKTEKEGKRNNEWDKQTTKKMIDLNLAI